MAQATDPPHQMSYEDVCKLVGRLYLECNTELERLRDMLFQQQQLFNKQTQELKESQELLAKLTHGSST